MYALCIIYQKSVPYLGLLGYFVPGGSPTCFGLGRGPIAPPGSAMVRTDRKDLNSNKTKQTNVTIIEIALLSIRYQVSAG